MSLGPSMIYMIPFVEWNCVTFANLNNTWKHSKHYNMFVINIMDNVTMHCYN